jgi:hypothetical protein
MAQESQANICSNPLLGNKRRPEENEKLLKFVKKDMNWKNIFKKIVDRSGKSYYNRYRFILKHIWNDPKIHDIIRLYNKYNLICI